jgi:hypothetical protein
MFFIKTWGKTKGVTRIMKNIKQAKGNECSQYKSTAIIFCLQFAHLLGLFSPCHA